MSRPLSSLVALPLVLSACVAAEPSPEPSPRAYFAQRVLTFSPGPGAGFGADKLPGIVLGPPQGAGAGGGSLDVVSLGTDGTIVLGFDGAIVDGPGPDLIVFENPFPGWQETGAVAISLDGATWHEWPCAATSANHEGCAGVHSVLANTANGIDARDPGAAGGDAFDLADLGVARGHFVRIRDTGRNPADPPTAGFDLDAVAVIHGE